MFSLKAHKKSVVRLLALVTTCLSFAFIYTGVVHANPPWAGVGHLECIFEVYMPSLSDDVYVLFREHRLGGGATIGTVTVENAAFVSRYCGPGDYPCAFTTSEMGPTAEQVMVRTDPYNDGDLHLIVEGGAMQTRDIITVCTGTGLGIWGAY